MLAFRKLLILVEYLLDAHLTEVLIAALWSHLVHSEFPTSESQVFIVRVKSVLLRAVHELLMTAEC